jgi:transcriptional regulator with XRE-family HTH domain
VSLEAVVGPTIRQIRRSLDLQGKDLAARVPMCRSYLSEVEHGHAIPSIALLGDIASGLGMKVADLWLEIYKNMEKN